ncbi:hypothetical protein FRC01_004289 [Tulasnella sp. 417]|nr:hypothetical protein FRC01_004289 [Tulasnella sp. 417]
MLRLYGTRSKNAPLDVFTRVDGIYDESTSKKDDWFEFLKLESSRVGTMTVAGDTPKHIANWVEHLEQSTFTSLAKLAFRNLEKAEAEIRCPIWASFPCLQDLWIEGCWCRGWVGPRDPFPPTLRSLKLTNISDVYYDDLIEALGGVLGLVSLAIEDFALDTDVSVPPNANRVTLDFLEELELTNVAVADIRAISLLVATPSLSSLSITSPSPSDGDHSFLTTFTAQHPQLSSLGIIGLKLESQELEMILHKLPNLNHLHIRSSDLAGDHVTFLEGETTPFPQLSLIVS